MDTLHVGSRAPGFELESIEGRFVRSDDFAGRKRLVAFLRNAGCAVCNLWVHETRARSVVWAALGLDVIVVFESSAARLREQFDGRVPPFVVLADPDGEAHDAYGSRVDVAAVRTVVEAGSGDCALARARAAGFESAREPGANFFRLPAEVLVHEDGTIAHLHVAEGVVDHLDPELVTRFARGELDIARVSGTRADPGCLGAPTRESA